MDALVEISRAYKATEELLDKQRAEMLAAMIAAHKAKASIADIARVTGYSREHASKLLAEARRDEAEEA